jgi:hypothetical protein
LLKETWFSSRVLLIKGRYDHSSASSNCFRQFCIASLCILKPDICYLQLQPKTKLIQLDKDNWSVVWRLLSLTVFVVLRKLCDSVIKQGYVHSHNDICCAVKEVSLISSYYHCHPL